MSYCEREYCVNVTDILLSRLPEDHSSWPGDELLQYMHDTYNVTDEFVEYLKVCYDYIDREEFSEEFLDWLNQWLFGEYGCDNPRYTFSSWLGFSLMPATLIIVILALFQDRVSKPVCCFKTKLGIPYPVNLVDGFTDRWSYACCFGITSSCIMDLFSGNYYIKLDPDCIDIPRAVKGALSSCATLLNVAVVGYAFAPFFMCISTPANLIGNLLGLMYNSYWTYFYTYSFAECPASSDTIRTVVYFLMLPILVCYFLLNLRYFFGFIHSIYVEYNRIDWKGKHRPAKLKKRHHDYLYVKNLLRPPPEKPKKETIRMKIRNILYKNVPGFKYSRKLISTLVVCAIVLFQVSFIQYAAVGTSLEYGCYEFFSEGGEGEEFFASINKSDLYEDAREITCTIYHTFMWSAYVTVVIYYAYLIHMVPVYRRYMLQMYRGDKSFWPPNLQSNVNLLVSSLKYSGYQIAYVLWGYIITQLILWVILFAVVYMIILAIQDDRSSLLLTLVAEYWFSAVFAVFLYIYQILVTKYIFLLEYGNVLGLNNRRLFHIVNYLLFFFNVILGLFSCLFRILKSMIFGVLFLGRTDRCLLMKGFETFDTGFTAYMGFLKVEETHMHPVLVTFCDILLTQTPVLTSNLPVNRDDSNNDDKRVSKLFSSRRNKNTMVTEADLEIESLVQAYRSCKVARNRWFVAYTLVRNPSVVSHRSPVPLLQKMMARSDDK